LENLMIVDMARNYLGKVCRPGSVRTAPLFHLETYPTLHQLTSTVRGELRSGTTFSDVIRACFPAASITGAPKVAAMRKIHELEISPRKIYTGSIGCICPDGNFCFNVAIRTLLCSETVTELGVGGGIVNDSDSDAELAEAMLKSRFVHVAEPDFELLETMLLADEKKISGLELHLRRMESSARFFNFVFDREKAMRLISSRLPELSGFSRLRLSVDFRGNFRLEAYPLKNIGWGKGTAKISLSSGTICSTDIFLRHKTTRRSFYDEQLRKAKTDGFDELIFTNERGELCEGAISNIFVQAESGKWFTPPLTCGLLPGIWRAGTIEKYAAHEKVLYPEDLKTARKILIGNSVRGGTEAQIG
ncbi:MAG: chorismate-binding protein, partial [Victivallales bacterium]|nr:chorismate-binding protein [Victivallales bacterium]